LYTIPIQYSPWILRAIRQEKEIRGIQIGKEKVKMSQFSDYLNLHLKDPEDSNKKLIRDDF
jgi:hypothetical protein